MAIGLQMTFWIGKQVPKSKKNIREIDYIQKSHENFEN